MTFTSRITMAACRLNSIYHCDTHDSLHLILIQIKSKAQGKAGSAIPLYFALIRDEGACRLLLQGQWLGKLCESPVTENIKTECTYHIIHKICLLFSLLLIYLAKTHSHFLQNCSIVDMYYYLDSDKSSTI